MILNNDNVYNRGCNYIPSLYVTSGTSLNIIHVTTLLSVIINNTLIDCFTDI